MSRIGKQPVAIPADVKVQVSGGAVKVEGPPSMDALRVSLPAATVIVVEGADHFFFGSLAPLGEAVVAWADALLGA